MEGISIVPMTAAHAEGTIPQQCANMFERNPLYIEFGITPAEVVPWFTAAILRSAREENSVVAVDDRTKEVVGFALNDDKASEWNLEWDASGEGEGLHNLDRLLDVLAASFKQQFPALKERQFLHINALGVRQDYGGRGIATELVKGSIRAALRLGYPSMVVECTNRATHNVCVDKLGFHHGLTVRYDEYEDEKHHSKLLAGLAARSPQECATVVWQENLAAMQL